MFAEIEKKNSQLNNTSHTPQSLNSTSQTNFNQNKVIEEQKPKKAKLDEQLYNLQQELIK